MATEKRLIDADALKAKFPFVGMFEKGLWHTLTIQKAIDNAPTVDAVEVVRCKDCKHWNEETGWCYHHSHFVNSKGDFCHPWESNDWKMFDADDYCSYGKRCNNE